MAHRTNWGVALLFFALGSVSCAGKSSSEGERPASGGFSAGGAASAAGGPGAEAGRAGEPTTTCPDAQPTIGEYCDYQGPGYCIYPIDECHSVSLQCVDHVWDSMQPAGGESYDCNSFYPPNAPKDGDACACLGKLDCTYDDCDARGRIHAVCDNASWHVTETSCRRLTCGPNGPVCAAGEVCVFHDELMPSYSCTANPCGATTPSCECAASVCDSYETCGAFEGNAIHCFCPIC